MFNVELKFASDVLLKCFNAKIKSKHLEIDPIVKLKYQRENPVDWVDGKCVICNFPIAVEPKGLEFNESEMSYIDFLIRKEHAILRNIYELDEIKKSENISSLVNYQKAFERFLQIIKNMEEEI